MYNISQINSKSLAITSIDPTDTEHYEANKTIHRVDSSETFTHDYYVLDANKLDIGNSKIIKLGYCVNEPEGFKYPIFLKIYGKNEEVEFQLGKTGMFEFQPELYKNVNQEIIEEETATVYVIRVSVPVGVNFCLDYCYEK